MSFNIEEGRYIILGSIDGLLATLGIIIGGSVVSASNAIIVSAAFGGAIALALTNGLGSYLAESTIEHGKLAMAEKSLLRKLNNTYVESQSRRKIAKGASDCDDSGQRLRRFRDDAIEPDRRLRLFAPS